MRPPRPAPRRPVLLAGLLCAALLGLLPQTAFAGTTISLFNSFAGNINFVTTGNTLRANDNSVNACTLLSGLTGTAVNAGTSSGTVSGIPVGSTIVAAYLYYAGSSSTVDNTVTFNGTGVTAGRTFTDTTIVPFFGGFVDVTSLVAGNGTYSFTGLTVDNSATYCGNQTVLAGWALVVIYSNASEAYRVVNVYDGFQAFQNSSITLTPANFKIPNPPVANSKFAVITWEGDDTLSGNETLQFNGNTLTDACNGANNQYNGTINTLICTGNPTTDDVFYGVDIDTFGVDSYVAAGQTGATTFYQSGGDAVMLAAQIISITDAPVSDLSISKVHNGTFGYGDNGTYTISVTNNGPTATSGTTTVSDTLPAGETYVSATGTGWTCGAAGQVVTCTSTSAIANAASFPSITLTAAVATSAGTSLANTATVAVDPSDFDNISGNNSSTDTVSNAGGTLVHPDLSTSTKTVLNSSGGDYLVGNTVQYTITLNETAGVAASNVSVTDNIPANLSGFTASAVTVTGSSTTITNSSTNTGGTNSDGLVSISNITVPANGSVTIVFTATVKTGTANCTTINNGATITYAGGSPTTQAPSAPTITVAQSLCTSSGSKILYVYDNTTAGFHAALSRIPQPAVTGTAITVASNGLQDFTLTPVLAKSLKFANTPDAGNVNMVVTLVETATGGSAGTARPTTVELRTAAGVSIATSGTVNVSNGPTAFTYTITVPQDTVVAAGGALVLRLRNNNATRTVAFSQKTAGQGASTITFNTPTVINVDSVNVYNAIYSATTQSAFYAPGTTVYICAAISDPFGSADVGSATYNIFDSNGSLAKTVSSTDFPVTVVAEGAKDCTGAASTSTEAFEYAYTLGASGTIAIGNWTVSVTGNEGTEGTVSHTANGSFATREVPSLLITKSVSAVTDPIEGATKAKAIPGATMLYTIQVQNNGRGSVDSGTLNLTDGIPANTAFYASSATPYVFTPSTSGLTGVTVTYSTSNGASYGALPSCPGAGTLPCQIPAITDVQFTTTGTMAGKTGATAPTFSITFQVVIQ